MSTGRFSGSIKALFRQLQALYSATLYLGTHTTSYSWYMNPTPLFEPDVDSARKQAESQGLVSQTSEEHIFGRHLSKHSAQ